MSVPRGSVSVLGVLMLSTEIVVVDLVYYLYLRRSNASWMNARSLLHIGHCDDKNVDSINKNWLPRQRTLSDRQTDGRITLFQTASP